MKVQSFLVQVRFIEIYEVFSKENKVGYFSNRVVEEIEIMKAVIS
jgi:hypothetical protein